MRLVVWIYVLICLPFVTMAADKYWIASSTSNWNNTANWSASSGGDGGESVPGSSDIAYFDGNGLGKCNIDASVDISGINLSAGYTGTISQGLGYTVAVGATDWIQAGGTLSCGNSAITISGNMNITGGLIKHGNNSTSETYKINISVGGDFTLGAGASVDVAGLGYNAKYGTGKASSQYGGGCYGGIGYYSTEMTYGSYLAPVNAGSGGWGGAGGGIIQLVVIGTSLINGNIYAQGEDNSVGSGSGGSIYLKTGSISGSGNISSNGGDPGGQRGGGGGRIAIMLTTVSSDFSGFTGSITAYGGLSSTSSRSGAAGTIYLEEEADNTGEGELIIDNNNIGTYSVTSIPDGERWNIYDLTVQNKGILSIGNGDTLDMKSDNISSDADYISLGIITESEGVFIISSPSLTISNFTIIVNDSSGITGDVIIGANGNIRHYGNSTAETYTMNFTIDGDLTINAGASINVNNRGYDGTKGPGAGSATYDGGTYAGIGADIGSDGNNTNAYGSITAPVNIGSGGGNSAYAGGGTIRLNVSGNTVVNGDITANGDGGGTGGGGSGGSVYLTTGSISGSGNITANGGGGSGKGGGGGGRVAVLLTDGGADFSSFTGNITAYGGYSTSASRKGTAGTVYKKLGDQTYGDLIIDNNNYGSTPSGVETYGVSGSTTTVNSLTIQNKGKLNLNNSTLHITGNNTTDISLGANCYLITEASTEGEKIQWDIGNSTGSYIFPYSTGDLTNLAFTFNATSAGTPISTGSVSVGTYTTADNNTPYPATVTHMDDDDEIDNADNAMDRFWIVDVDDYSSNPTATVTYAYTDNDLTGNDAAFTEDKAKVQKWDDGWHPVTGTVNTSNNTITVVGLSSFSPWAISNNDDPLGGYEAPLPVELLYFTATLTNEKYVTLDWTTASETNNNYFQVEKCDKEDCPISDSWEILDTVKGKIFSTTNLYYQLIDDNIISNTTIYYRIKQVDFDGKTTILKTTSVFDEGIEFISAFPNPAEDEITIYLNVYTETNIIIDLINSNGMQIKKVSVPALKGFNEATCDLKGLSSGMYYLRITTEDGMFYESKDIIIR